MSNKMSKDCFKSALKSLRKSPEIGRLQKILVLIRKEVEWPLKKCNIYKLQKNHCFKHLVECLLKPDAFIVNTTLSILGNCCLDRNISRILVVELDLLNTLSHILKRYSLDCIRGRIFRVLGNLCQHHDYHARLLLHRNPQLQIISHLVDFLKSIAKSNEFHRILPKNNIGNTNNIETFWSNATVCMAIRTLREIVSVNTLYKMVEQYEIVKIIGMLIYKFTPKWMATGQYGDVLLSVLKVLHLYSKQQTAKLIPDLQNCGSGNAMNYLGKLLILSPYMLVKIVMNMLKTCNLRSDLPIIDISENLIQKLGNASNFTNGREDLQHREYLKCLCFLLQHPANKEDLRNAGIIPVFMSILKDYAEKSEISLKNCTLTVSTLRICMYDDVSLLSMIKCDIINVLISKLNWAVGMDNNFDLSHVYKSDPYLKKRRKFMTNKCFMHKLTSDGFGFPCCSTNDISFNYIRYNKERSISPNSDLSLSSEPCSPANPVLSNNDDSDDYSPVCSESEENKTQINTTSVDEDMVYNPSPYHDFIEKSSEAGSCDDHYGKSMNKKMYMLSNEIVKLLKLFSKLRPAVVELVTTDILIKLLNFLFPKNANICPPDTLAVILSIIETPEFLLPLMQTDFVTATHKFSSMSHSSDCLTCAHLYYISRVVLFKFTIAVESGSGKGDIAHQLHRASLPVKQRLVSSIPFVTGSTYIFMKLMIDCGGLNILIQSFQEQSSIQLKSICSLCLLATKLGIKNPAITPQNDSVFMHIFYDNYELPEDCSTSVNFKLDDGSSIKADRVFLCERSDYFKCLLSGEFKESCENEITLHNVPNKALKLLFILLHIDVNNTEIYKIDADLDLLLDVIALCESYLLSDLCNCLMLSIQYFKLSHSTIPIIYQWSLESGTDILRVESIAFALVAVMKDSERNNMFTNLLSLNYTDKLADDIKKLLIRFLGPTRNL